MPPNMHASHRGQLFLLGDDLVVVGALANLDVQMDTLSVVSPENHTALTSVRPPNQRVELVWMQITCSPGSWEINEKRPSAAWGEKPVSNATGTFVVLGHNEAVLRVVHLHISN